MDDLLVFDVETSCVDVGGAVGCGYGWGDDDHGLGCYVGYCQGVGVERWGVCAEDGVGSLCRHLIDN